MSSLTERSQDLSCKISSFAVDADRLHSPFPREQNSASKLFSITRTVQHLNGDSLSRWYHGSITRIEAEGLLRVHQEGSYLVRNSESTKQDYSLSLK